MSVTDIDVYKIAVSMVKGYRCADIKLFVEAAGGVVELFENTEEVEESFGAAANDFFKALTAPELLESAHQQYDIVKKFHTHLSFFTDSDYPSKLRDCSDSPVLLYCSRKFDFDSYFVISIIGTRKADNLAERYVDSFLSELSKSGRKILILSGLADGVDSIAHKAALKYGFDTVAVLGHGFDKIYPYSNRGLASQIRKSHGALITEFYSGYPLSPENFPQRNRIVAGLCDALLVVQTPLHGGSMNTVALANSYGREVFAFPGRPDDELFAGCNRLIRNNNAAILNSAEDFAYYMGWGGND